MLTTVDSVIDAIGGPSEAAKLASVGAPAVSNWKSRGRIPAELHSIFSDVLKRSGKEADPSLFGMRPLTPADMRA